MGTPQGNISTDATRTGVQRLREGLATSAALGATITVVAGTVVSSTEVTALDDQLNADGTTSLREAIRNADSNAGADTITFSPALFAGGPAVIELGSTLNVRGDDVTIAGPGADQLTLRTSAGSVDALYFYGEMAVSVSNVTIESTGDGIDARASYYGTYYGPGGLKSVTLSGVDISADGRALNISGVSGDVSVSNSNLTGTDSDGYSYGRSIATVRDVYGGVTLTDVTLDEATPALAADSFGPGGNQRNGLYVSGVRNVTLTRTTTDTSYSGVRIRRADDVEISESSMTGNEGIRISYADDVYITDSDVTVSNDDPLLVPRLGRRGSSTAVSTDFTGSVLLDEVTLTGGGVETSYASQLVIANSTISEAPNGAVDAAGVRFGMVNSTISNSATLYGNALIAAGGSSYGGCGMCFDSNSAIAPGLGGPGYFDGIVMLNSTITENTVSNGGALVSASDSYGGRRIYSLDGGSYNSSSAVIISSTISGNSVDTPDGPSVAVINAQSAGIDHSIVTDNGSMVLFDSEPMFDDADSLGGANSIIEMAPSLETNHSILPAADAPIGLAASLAEDTNIFTDSPGLSALGDHGGLTETMMPDADSPAVDGGAADPVIPDDQRGEVRPSGESTDIGAVERQASTISISVDPATVAEADGTLAITLTRDGEGEGDASVRVSTSNGTATAGEDYTAISQVVAFPAGTSVVTVDLAVATDTKVEGNETLKVTLSEADNVSIGASNVEVTITDSTTTPTTTTPTTTTTTTVPTTTTPTTTPTTSTPTTTTTDPVVTTTTAPPLTLRGTTPPAVAGGGETTLKVTVEKGDDEEIEVTAKSSNSSLLEVVSVTQSQSGNAFTRGSAELTEVTYDVRLRAAVGGSGNATITVTVEGETSTATQEFVVEVSSQTLPATGSNTTQRTGLIGALLLGFGFMTSMFSRRRRV